MNIKITSVQKSVSFVIETNLEPSPTFRRFEHGSWERLMNNSWEEHYDDGELEALYQQWRIDNP